jgi:hypothetical protein
MHLKAADQIPHQVQQIMSGESTPILAGAIPCFEAFMSTWERLAELHPKFEPWIDAGMEYAIAYYGCMDHMHSYIMAMGESPDLLILITALTIVFDKYLIPASA